MTQADILSRWIAEALMAREGVSRELGIELMAVAEGFARISMTVQPGMLNGHGAAHGGFIFTLADSAFAYVCNGRNQASVAQQASIAFLSPALSGERLIAEARERAVQGRSGVCEVVVTGPDDRVVAVFQGLSRAVGGPVLTHSEESPLA